MTNFTDSRTESYPSTFGGDLQSSMQELRGALTNLLASMGDDARAPQEVSRKYGINKNLSWKVSKIIFSEDPNEAVQHVPGVAGIRILIQAFKKAGARRDALDAVSEAVQRFNQMIRVHVGDRANLELYVGSTRPDGIHSEQLEDKRRLAYQGNSAIWGVQARLGFSLRLIAPNKEDPERADIGTIGGLHGFRRLRSTTCWPVLQLQSFGEDIDSLEGSQTPMEDNDEGQGAPLIRDFCSTPTPTIRAHKDERHTTFELCEGPVGNTAATDVTFGMINRHQVPAWSGEDNSVGEHYCRIDTPMEQVQFDLLIHQALPFELPPRLVSYSKLHDNLEFPLSRADRFHLPGTAPVRELPRTSVGLVTPHISNYDALVKVACERMGYPVGEFRAFRVSITFPAMPTILVLYHPLGRAREN